MHILLAFCLLAIGSPSIVKKEIISGSLVGKDCHTPSVVTLDENDLAVVWFQSQNDGYGNFDPKAITEIFFSSFIHDNWNTPKLVSHSVKKAWNPVLAYSPDKELFLFYKIGDTPRQWIGLMSLSMDQGDTFSVPEPLPAGVVGPTHSKVVFDKNLMLCPSSVERGEFNDQYRISAGWIDMSSDQGKTWKKMGPIVPIGKPCALIEPALYIDRNHVWHVLARNRAFQKQQRGCLFHSESVDEGKTWSDPIETSIPNPDSPVDIIRLQDGALLLAHHPDFDSRRSIMLSLSNDDGRSWEPWLLVDTSEGECYYPSITETQNGHIHVVYSKTDVAGANRAVFHVEVEKSSKG